MSQKIPSIHSLHAEKNIKEVVKNEIYTVVLNKCIEKVLYTNRHTDKTFVYFEVPKILIGYPLYDMKSCILFLINRLSQHKYMVDFIEPFYLYIDWGTPTIKVPASSSTNYQPKVEYNTIRTKDPEKLKQQTKQLLQKFPNTSRVEFVYADKEKPKKNKKK